ncbi:hypothetical protein EA848_15005 [Vibrio anguillarum]|nr:hypothetical protein [Vibrio anguillarum]MBF4340457.1 hypothetical protein [Vibrio anguillarum]MBF4358086.1 hypothetical protein [Vibrio anguillarum]MBF4392214.1 hypothetical protein [Vibrio anguillarum]MBF4430915.1 hypothetical protein [Vibrio anguillarum]
MTMLLAIIKGGGEAQGKRKLSQVQLINGIIQGLRLSTHASASTQPLPMQKNGVNSPRLPL